MSAHSGKVVVDGIVTLGGEKVFALQFLQARNADWVRKPFYAKFDSKATWFDQLVPAFGEKKFFFQEGVTSPHKDDAFESPIPLAALSRMPKGPAGSYLGVS